MHRLDRIRIAGFKSIRDQTLDLQPLNVLIGANGAGKSNFIEVFRFLHEVVSQNLQLFVARSGGADRLLHFGSRVTDQLLVHLDFGFSAYHCQFVPAVDGALIFTEERVVLRNPGEDRVWETYLGTEGHRESLLQDEVRAPWNEYIPNDLAAALETLNVYHFHDMSPLARIKQTADVSDNVTLRPDASNLAAFLYRFQETERDVFRKILDTVRLVAPFFGSFDLQPDRLNPRQIKLEWKEKGSDTYFDAHALSDGTLRFLCLATLLLQPSPPTTVLIDEPELGLHPYAIAVLADLLRAAAERTQVIVSTQSVTLVNQLSPEDIVVVDREGRESVFRRQSSATIESWLDGYSLGELWEKNVLGGRPRL